MSGDLRVRRSILRWAEYGPYADRKRLKLSHLSLSLFYHVQKKHRQNPFLFFILWSSDTNIQMFSYYNARILISNIIK